MLLNWRDKRDKGYGGAEVVVEKIAQEISKEGHEVTLFTSRSGASPGKEMVGNVRVLRMGSRDTVYIFAILHMLANREMYDAVIESVNTVPFFSTLLFSPSCVFVLVHHIMGRHIFFATNPLKAAAAGALEALIPKMYKNANFIVLSKFVRSQLEDMGIERNRIHIIRIPYERISDKKEPKFSIPTLITTGRLVRQKRVDIIIRILGKLTKEKGIDAKLIIAGAGKERTRLEELSKHMGLEHNIKFTGFLDQKAKVSMLKRAWIFTTASLIEGFGLSALEAELCSLPVVAFANGGLSESVKNSYSGFLIKEKDETAYADKVAMLLSNKRLREKMGRNARKYSLSLERPGIEKLIKLIESVPSKYSSTA